MCRFGVTKLVATATPLKDGETITVIVLLFVANSVKIGPLDIDIIGLTEIVKNI